MDKPNGFQNGIHNIGLNARTWVKELGLGEVGARTEPKL